MDEMEKRAAVRRSVSCMVGRIVGDEIKLMAVGLVFKVSGGWMFVDCVALYGESNQFDGLR